MPPPLFIASCSATNCWWLASRKLGSGLPSTVMCMLPLPPCLCWWWPSPPCPSGKCIDCDWCGASLLAARMASACFFLCRFLFFLVNFVLYRIFFVVLIPVACPSVPVPSLPKRCSQSLSSVPELAETPPRSSCDRRMLADCSIL